MLKQRTVPKSTVFRNPAAFRRLCVETSQGTPLKEITNQPPLGGCVLKHCTPCVQRPVGSQPPLGGCVLKHYGGQRETMLVEPAAFRRLCVETAQKSAAASISGASRL